MDNDGRIVAAIGIVQQAVGWVKDGVKESDEHSGLVLLVEEIVDFGQTAPGSPRPMAEPLRRVRADIMNKAAGTPLSETSAHREADAAVLKAQDVVKVPAYFPGGQHAGVYLVNVADGELGRQDGLLDLWATSSSFWRATSLSREARASRHSIIWRRVRSMVTLRSAKSMGFVTKSNAPRFIAVRMFFMSP